MQIGASLLLLTLIASATVEEIGQAVQDTYDGGGYQTEHPLPRPVDFDSIPDIPDALVVILKVLLWTGVAVVVILLTVAIVRRLRGRDVDPAKAGKTVLGARPPPPLDVPLGDAAALAAQGRYGEATHVLLLRTIQTLAEHQRIPPSLTSREIVGQLELGEEPDQALQRLVEVVEVSHFGGQEADRTTYEACVEAFEALRSSLARSAP